MSRNTPARGPAHNPFPALPPEALIGQRPQPQEIKSIDLPDIPAPTYDFIMIERIYVGASKDSKIVIPQNLIEKEMTAIVIAVGPGRKTDWGHEVKPCCAVGDKVMLSPGCQSIPMNFSGRFLFLVPNNAIVGIYKKAEPAPSVENQDTQDELKLSQAAQL